MIARMPTWAEVDARVQADVVVLSAPRRTRYLIGLHLGQAQDYSAWVVAKRNERDGRNAAYDIGHLDRVQGARYPAVVAHTRALIAALRAHEPRADIELVVDFTGVGRAVADLLVDEIRGADVELVTITGGYAVTRGEHGEWRVPKRDLASVVQVLLQSSQLRIAEELAHARTLTEELVNFRVKISLAGHDAYGAGAEWREGNHDDLVLALALACWRGECGVQPRIWIV
jgi:hypothetical protein